MLSLIITPPLHPIPSNHTVLTGKVHISIRKLLIISLTFVIIRIPISPTPGAFFHTAFVMMAAVIAVVDPLAHFDGWMGLLLVAESCSLISLKLLIVVKKSMFLIDLEEGNGVFYTFPKVPRGQLQVTWNDGGKKYE